jgi:hypothetical protein
MTLEPLFVDESKFAGVGKVRGVSYGTATDYYGSSSATGIIEYSYTFETVNQDMGFACSGVGGCITNVGVDMR